MKQNQSILAGICLLIAGLTATFIAHGQERRRPALVFAFAAGSFGQGNAMGAGSPAPTFSVPNRAYTFWKFQWWCPPYAERNFVDCIAYQNSDYQPPGHRRASYCEYRVFDGAAPLMAATQLGQGSFPLGRRIHRPWPTTEWPRGSYTVYPILSGARGRRGRDALGEIYCLRPNRSAVPLGELGILLYGAMHVER